ncbi:MAG: tRNA (adenosine(37)-N6)-dimethylallyltransferase MiaA [Bacteroidota bacterium]
MAVKTLISIVGPTGIGKTAWAIQIARHFKTEIISSDSRQFFKEMSIGTAVPSKEELAMVPHHFIQHKSIFETYSVGDFERDALSFLTVFFKVNDMLVMVGGSGLYNDAVIHGLDEFPNIDPEIRIALDRQLKERGIGSLQDQLKRLDRSHYEKIDLENPHRLIRALEVCMGTGKPYSSFLGLKKKNRTFNVITVGVGADREIIYRRINKRVDVMIKNGLVQEAESLKEHRTLNALQTVGYKELFSYFDGEWPLDFAISEIKKNTRRFAKRQLTWFKRNEHTLWIDFDENWGMVSNQIENRLKQQGNG